MSHVEPKMTLEQMASLLEAALRHRHPLTYLDMAIVTFKSIGRNANGMTAVWLGWLHAEGEMEILLGLRAAWRRGEPRSLSQAARRTVVE